MVLSKGLVIFVLVVGFLAFKLTRKSGKRPPGPRRLPLIGSILQIPKETPWKTFSQWGNVYGDFMHLDVLGKLILIINTKNLAKDLVDKRSAIYSDRPRSIMAGELCGFNETFVMKPYGDDWRNQRKVIAHHFSQSMASRYFSLQEKQACRLVTNVIKEPESLSQQVKLQIGIIIVRVTYGYYIKDEDDPFLTVALQAMANFNEATTPGNFLVDLIPPMKHMPTWMPGSGFLQKAEAWRRTTMKAIWDPYVWSKGRFEAGETSLPSLCSAILQEHAGGISEKQERHLVYAAGSMLGGGLDTNMSTVLTFFLAMVLHRGVQQKAQAEIDSVIGTDRLPNVSDRASLPYIRSLIAEILRWNPALPLGLPHSLTKDDVYNGYYLPKGTTVLINLWRMLHDPVEFPDPMSFNPDRYENIDAKMAQVTEIAFGFGRRTCPGSHFGMGTLFAIVLVTLATCDILPGLDDDGKEVIPEIKYSSGTISTPAPFKLRLIPRSSRAQALLEEAILDSNAG